MVFLWMVLTYMSIRDNINAHIAAGRLFYLPPQFASTRAIRTMIVAPDLFSNLQPSAWPNNKTGERLGRLRADLDRFTANDRISIALFPQNKPKTTYMARIEPVSNEVWDIRSADPNPGTRVLGRFSEKDTFVALVWDFHENLKGAAWGRLGDRCLNEWANLFPNYAPHKGSSASDYISSNFFPV
jgi:hypothetical protein